MNFIISKRTSRLLELCWAFIGWIGSILTVLFFVVKFPDLSSISEQGYVLLIISEQGYVLLAIAGIINLMSVVSIMSIAFKQILKNENKYSNDLKTDIRSD